MQYNVWAWAIGSVSIVSVLSLCGVILIPVKKKETLQAVIFFLISFACGAMLGNAFFNLIPEAYEHGSDQFTTSVLIASGVLLYFIVAKVLNLRCHHVTGGHCHDEHPEHGIHGTPGAHIHITGWMSLVSHMMDNFTDGVGIGASFLISWKSGIQTASGVIAHEWAHEFGCFGVLVNANFSRFAAIMINFTSAMVATAGCVLVLWLGSWMQHLAEWLTPICAGIFLSISMSGLIPEMQKEMDTRRSIVQVAIVLLGLAVVGALRLYIPE